MVDSYPYCHYNRTMERRRIHEPGRKLSNARKKSGMSQEVVAEKLGVNRQTISKWETDETLPDIRQSKRLSALYHLTLDELVDCGLRYGRAGTGADRQNHRGGDTAEGGVDETMSGKVSHSGNLPPGGSNGGICMPDGSNAEKNCGPITAMANSMPFWC